MPKKILVVEDNEQNRILMRQILKHHGYEVLEAADGAAGLEMAREHMPDLILLDLQMPVMGGFAVIRELRKTPELSKLKVIAVTSFAMKGDREKALEAGFDEYVTKPIDTRKFVELVKEILLPGETDARRSRSSFVSMMNRRTSNCSKTYSFREATRWSAPKTGKTPCRRSRTGTIDLVLLDLMLPGMDGLQVSRKIKENKKYRHIPIIMLTAHSGVESYIKSLSNEVFAYIHKPFETEELVKNREGRAWAVKGRPFLMLSGKVSSPSEAQRRKLAFLNGRSKCTVQLCVSAVKDLGSICAPRRIREKNNDRFYHGAVFCRQWRRRRASCSR